MRVWWLSLLLVGATLAIPGAVAEPECETTGVVERCDYDDEVEHEIHHCSDGWARGCDHYNQTVSGTRYQVGDTWVFIGEERSDGYSWREFEGDCPERFEDESQSSTSFIRAGSGSTRAGVGSSESDSRLDGRAECEDETTEQKQRSQTREHEARIDDPFVHAHLRITEQSYEWQYTNNTRNETRSECGTALGVYADATMVPAIGHGQPIDHCGF